MRRRNFLMQNPVKKEKIPPLRRYSPTGDGFEGNYSDAYLATSNRAIQTTEYYYRLLRACFNQLCVVLVNSSYK